MAVKIASTRPYSLVSQSNPGTTGKTLRGIVAPPSNVTSYVRNPSWPAISTVTSSDHKIIALYAVWPGDGSGNGANFVEVNCAGAYTVNFGDGSAAVNTGSGVTTSYEYNYNNASLNNTNAPVTLTDAGDVITRTNHGYTNGMPVQFFNIVSTTGLTEGANYYVINATTNTFQVATSTGGSAVALTTNGTATLLPYKVAVITITPQAGNNITSVSFPTDAAVGGSGFWNHSWIEMTMSLPYLTSFTTSASVRKMVEAVYFVNTGSCSYASLFYDFTALRYVSIGTTTATSLDATQMFSSCIALLEFTILLATAALITNASQMFLTCYSLQKVSNLNIVSATSTYSMFYRCNSLQTITTLNIASSANMNSMFYQCYSLQSLPFLDATSATDMSYMFYQCYALKTSPIIKATSATDMSYMFYQCYALENVPALGATSVTNVSYMFSQCYTLKTMPTIDISSANNVGSMFQSCVTLEKVINLNVASANNMANTFDSCYSLQTVSLSNTSSMRTMSSTFANCFSLQTVSLSNTSFVTNMSYMFNYCMSLRKLTPLNLSSCTTTSAMFANCYSIEAVSLYNTGNVTNLTNTFLNCRSLKYVTTLNGRSATSLNSMFYNCQSLVRAPLIGNTGSGSIATSVNWNNMFTEANNLRFIPAYDLSKMAASVANTWWLYGGYIGLNTQTYNHTIQRIQAYGYTGATKYHGFVLSGPALDEIYINLPTSTATITVTGNYGTATHTPSIATAKGWTVTVV